MPQLISAVDKAPSGNLHLSTQRLLTPERPQVFPLTLSGANILQPGKLRKNQLSMETQEVDWNLKTNKSAMTSADCPPAAGMSLTPLGHRGSTPHHCRHPPHHAKASKALSYQHPHTRSLCSPRQSPACSCCAPTPACTFGFGDSSSVWHLPAAAPARTVAVPTSPVTQTCCWPCEEGGGLLAPSLHQSSQERERCSSLQLCFLLPSSLPVP